MELVNCLKKVLKSSTWKPQSSPDETQKILLEDGQSGMKTYITKISSPVAALRTGGKGAVNHWGAIENEYIKICDYIIVWKADTSSNNYYIIFIEMKKTLTSSKKGKGCEQLLRSLPIWNYLLSVCKIEGTVSPKISLRYVLIAGKLSERLDKQSIKGRQAQYFKEKYGKNKTLTIKLCIGKEFSINTLTKVVRGKMQ